MSLLFYLISYAAAGAAVFLFWQGFAKDVLILRLAAATAATVGIWMGESAERRSGAGLGLAATLNGLLLLVMAALSLYLHFAD